MLYSFLHIKFLSQATWLFKLKGISKFGDASTNLTVKRKDSSLPSAIYCTQPLTLDFLWCINCPINCWISTLIQIFFLVNFLSLLKSNIWYTAQTEKFRKSVKKSVKNSYTRNYTLFYWLHRFIILYYLLIPCNI